MVHIKHLDKKGGGGELSIHYIYNSFSILFVNL